MTSFTHSYQAEEGFSPSISSLGNGPSASFWDRVPFLQQIKNFAPVVLAVGSLTRPAYPDPLDLAQSISRTTAMHAPVRRRKGRRITLAEARQIALRAMELTDRLLAEERAREAEYFRRLADTD